ncbi:MAG: glycosyltransferase family 4 protein, partial [Rhodospirillales bacterium]|nr:glycosyltransferase family 4 protein [Rhodospirillales bacterium]
MLQWQREIIDEGTGRPVQIKVPLNSRRVGEQLQMEYEVANLGSIESATDRARWFARLVEENSLDQLREPIDESDEVGVDHLSKRCNSDAAPLTSPPKVEPVLPELRVAVVHDFLYTYGGAERVLEQILALLPQANLFALFDFLPEGQRDFIGNREVTTTVVQRLPMASKKHRAYLPLMPLAIEQLDVSGYDMIVSSSYMAAKGVITGPGQMHVCYCHSPVRYAWDLQHQYLNEASLGYGPRGLLARSILHYVRNWDARSAVGVDHFISNSHFVTQRIEKLYRRTATVIHPPVETHRFALHPEKEAFYVTASRLVSYKRMDLIVEAFNRMPERRLIVIGDGPERQHLESIAGPNVSIVGHLSNKRLAAYFAMAKAFVFAAEEDFGIVPVEAMACGTPVIAYGRGGALETVVPGRTGIFFHQQTSDAIYNAVRKFEETDPWNPAAIRAHTEQFGIEAFTRKLGDMLEDR